MPQAASVQCDNPECRVSETGRCVEGLELSDCPHLGRMSPGVAEQPEVVEPEEEAEESLTLPTADRLTVSAAASVLRAGESRVIAVLGPTDSGKTSLIASLYDLFQQGPVEKISFAESRTLHAFERACHDARAASMRAEPRIDRTPIGGVAFYHLCLGGDIGLLNLLMADRAGEEYRALADDPSGGTGFAEITRADTLSVLVDGERLLDSGARHNVRSEVVMTLQALVDGEATNPGQRVALILTKFDAVVASPLQPRAEADFNALLQKVRQLFGSCFGAVEPFHTAASPKSTEFSRGFGLDAVLRFWLAHYSLPVPDMETLYPAPARAISRLTVLEP